MNILFVDKRFPTYGGIAVVTKMLSEQFVKDGHRVVVATLMPKLYEGMEDLIPDGVIVIGLKTPTWNLANIKKLRSIIEDYDIDFIINQWALHFEVSFILNQARKGTKAKLISELHGAANTTKMLISQTEKVRLAKGCLSKAWEQMKLSIFHAITKFSVRYTYKICDKYVLLSKGFIPELVKYANLKEQSKLGAIGNAIGISSNGFSYDMSKKEKRILYVGRMDPYNKRVDRIVEAWESIYKKYPDWSLELVGEGPQLPYLKQYVKDKNIGNVRFHPFTKEPPTRHYEAASILLLTSDLEGFGLVIIESMQFGCVPIVYGSYIAIYDILENGKDGFITPMPYSKDKTVAYLERLIENDELRDKMARSAIEKSKEFKLDKISQEWYSIFK